MARQIDRSEATRAKLLAAFREAFLRDGFEGTAIQSVLDETGLSKGALYHHFSSKAEIIEALYIAELEHAVAQAQRSFRPTRSYLSGLEQASIAWVEQVRDPEISRLLFEIAPAAIGVAKAHEIESEFSLSRIERMLQLAVKAGELAAINTALVASMVNALLTEAVLHERRTKEDALATLKSALRGLFTAFT
ncbi:MAG: TetR/AcrR family transcriptional regulator [Pseudomonadota bacterium]